MDNKFSYSPLVFGLIASLVACRPQAVAEPVATVPAPSQVAVSETSAPEPSQVPDSETLAATPSPLPTSSEALPEFNCDTAHEIVVWDCRARMARAGRNIQAGLR